MRRLLPLALLALLAPLAQAAQPQPFTGSLVFGADAHLRGEGALGAPDALLDLTPAVLAGEPVNLSWSSASGYHFETVWAEARTRDASMLKRRIDDENASIATGPGLVEGVACGPRCQLVVLGMGAQGTRVALEGRLDGPVRRLEEPRAYWAELSQPGNVEAFYHGMPAGSVAAGPGLTAVYDAAPAATGRLGLFVRDGVVTFRTADGPVRVGNLWADERVHAPGGVAATGQERAGFAFVVLEGASLSMAPGSAAVLLARAPTVALAGTLSTTRATGTLTTPEGTVRLEDAPLLLRGDFEAALGSTAAGAVPLVQADPPLRADLRGEADLAVVGGRALVEAPAVSAGAVAAGFSLAALLGVLWLLLHGGGLAPFYSRIRRSRVLAHERRQEIHRILGERPGLTLMELARATGMVRVVLQHHLRMLETHQVIVTRMEGRRRTYFLAGQIPPPPVLHGQAALRDASRKRIADLLAQAGRPLTQSDLSRELGLSQRLVSYHLSQLESAGLVASEGRLPRRYRPTDLLGLTLEGKGGS